MFNWNIKQSPILGLLGLSGVGSRILSFAGGFSATGGTTFDIGSYRAHIFTSPGSFVVSGDGLIDIVIVAGGGGGSSCGPGPGNYPTNIGGNGGSGIVVIRYLV